MRLFRAIALVGCAFAAFACVSSSTTPRMRVAQDLGCTADETKVERIEKRAENEPPPRPGMARWQVTGCGRTAVYLCTAPVRDCWREGGITALPADH